MHIDVESIVVNLNCLDEPSSLTWALAQVRRWTQRLIEAGLVSYHIIRTGTGRKKVTTNCKGHRRVCL